MVSFLLGSFGPFASSGEKLQAREPRELRDVRGASELRDVVRVEVQGDSGSSHRVHSCDFGPLDGLDGGGAQQVAFMRAVAQGDFRSTCSSLLIFPSNMTRPVVQHFLDPRPSSVPCRKQEPHKSVIVSLLFLQSSPPRSTSRSRSELKQTPQTRDSTA